MWSLVLLQAAFPLYSAGTHVHKYAPARQPTIPGLYEYIATTELLRTLVIPICAKRFQRHFVSGQPALEGRDRYIQVGACGCEYACCKRAYPSFSPGGSSPPSGWPVSERRKGEVYAIHKSAAPAEHSYLSCTVGYCQAYWKSVQQYARVSYRSLRQYRTRNRYRRTVL